MFHVQSHNAHAWPEIWLAGLGWTHLFDPTPPAGSSGTTVAGGSTLPGDPATVTPITAAGHDRDDAPRPTHARRRRPAAPGARPPTTSAPVPPLVSTTAPGGDAQPWLVVARDPRRDPRRGR